MPDKADWFLLAWVLVCVVVVLGMSYWATRLIAGKGLLGGGMNRKSGGRIKVVAQEVIGKDQRLVVAAVGEKCFLLGVTSNAISMLSELPADEIGFEMKTGEQTVENHPSFLNAFSDLLKEKLRR